MPPNPPPSRSTLAATVMATRTRTTAHSFPAEAWAPTRQALGARRTWIRTRMWTRRGSSPRTRNACSLASVGDGAAGPLPALGRGAGGEGEWAHAPSLPEHAMHHREQYDMDNAAVPGPLALGTICHHRRLAPHHCHRCPRPRRRARQGRIPSKGGTPPSA